ncbi:PAS domain-containing sensor histidine kinase [Xylanibacter ruminicola]|uniref:sensor histidine kinase n=1 Tax=Xylanibacter ruminicola TaxID=839 RepID=UPI000691517A|nr:PAS domain-containing sensor histidine kinase [Xylanibacter ruminicola]
MNIMFDEQQAMMMALNISGNHVMCLDLKDNRVYDLHGKAMFGNNVGIDICYTYIHPDDRERFRTFVERLSDGTDLEADCHYRWDYNYTGQGEPDWHDMYGRAIAEYEDGKPVNIIATLTDETEVKQKEREVEHLSERYRSIFENSIIGMSFYSPEGWLIDANQIMRQICHFDSDTSDEFFSKMNLFDVMPFNEVLDRENPEDYWACSLSIVPERNMRVYLEISVHPIYDEKGKLMYISVTANDVTEERNMYLNVMENDARMKKMNEAIKNYEAELRYMLQASKMQTWRISLERDTLEFYDGLNTVMRSFSLEQLQKIFVDQEHPFVKALSDPAETLKKPLVYVGQMYPVVTQSSTENQWVQINCIPEFDKEGNLLGAFGVWRNVNDLMCKQDQLRKETKRARESGQLKTLFLANMTHEIRTPINSIVGFTEVLSALEGEDKKEVIQIIKNNCDMLLRLINDILTVSSLESGQMDIRPVEVDFAKSFNELFESLRSRVQEPGVEFIKDNPYATLPIKVDVDRVSQVITNFLTNAVKYTHQGHIKLGYHTETRTIDGKQLEGLYVYCEDTGDGIAPESQPRIFDRFYKVNDFVQGTGLGLSICKAFTDACHGDIGVVSEGKGKGSVFWMWIPL